MRVAQRRSATPLIRLSAALGSIMLGLALALCAFVAPAGAAGAHALPVHYDPPPRALLQAPPSGVTITFSENVNPATSRIIVVDPTNREVDNRDSQVNANDGHIMSVTLPLLPAGTYVVVWKTQSADDGHVTSGSYYFQIARPDGSAPPLPSQLPTGNVLGGGGTSADSATLDGPSILQTASTWLALLFLTFWVGGVICETWILPLGSPTRDPQRSLTRDADLRAAAGLAARRFRQLAPVALGLLLLANVGIILAEAAALAGDWSGLFAPQLLHAILFGSRFGVFWWCRELLALAALILLLLTPGGGRPSAAPSEEPHPASEAGEPAADGLETSTGEGAIPAIPDWRRELVATLRDIRHLPARLARGVRALAPLGQVEVALALLLVLAFALSGHAAAVPTNIFAYAIAVDVLHLLGDTAWLGGMLYIGVVLLPVLRNLPLARRARVLALGLPQFGALAIVSATVLAATGSLNATIRMNSFLQFLTTAYGRTLAIKIELFLIMAAVSTYHAFFLRPRLSRALVGTPSDATAVAAPESVSQGVVEGTLVEAAVGGRAAIEPAATVARTAEENAGGKHTSNEKDGVRRLSERLEGWLRREAILGGGVLLCVALLGAYAGTLVPPASNNAGTPSSGPFVSQAQQAGPYMVTLKVTPATFGTNAFIVTVKDAQGQPVSNVAVLVQTTMLDMDMGTQNLQLQPQSGVPGSYRGQGDLTMAGHWGVVVKVLPPGQSDFVSTTFKFTAGY
jgi:putative copper export protein/methionine-rich copper-binding protein CopC